MKNTALILMLLTLAACGHHRDVRPGPQGINKVVVSTDEVQKGTRNAMDQATHFCKEHNKHPIYLKEEKKYVGTIDEKLYAQTKMITRGAKTASYQTRATNPRKVKNQTSDLLRVGSTSADSALGDGYLVSMTFKCE